MAIKKTYEYNIFPVSYYDSQQVEIKEFCNGFLAVNKGDQLVRVNGFPLKPFPPGHPELSGESFGVIGLEGEIYTGNNHALEIVFDNTAGTNPWLIIVQKVYTNYPNK